MELERELAALGRELEWPPTPPLAAAVYERLEAPSARWRAWRLPARKVLVPALVLLLLAAGVAMASSAGVRDAVLRFLHLRGAEVVRVRRPPRAPAGRSSLLGLGRRVSLAEARARAEFRPLLPSGPGWAAYLADGRVSFRRGRLLIGEFRGVTRPSYVFKEIGPGTTVRRVSVRGSRGWWIAGRPHGFAYEAPNGTIELETLRLAANTLLWNERGLLVRIEGARTLAGALVLARSLGR